MDGDTESAHAGNEKRELNTDIAISIDESDLRAP